MAQVNNMLLQGLSGTLGDLVFYQRNGKTKVRRKPAASKKGQTPAQQRQRHKFAQLCSFAKKLYPLAEITFEPVAKRTRRDVMFRLLMKNPGRYNDGEFSIDYASITISKGTLLPPFAADATCIGKGQVSFIWGNNAYMGNASPYDTVLVAVYCKELDMFLYFVNLGSRMMCEMVVDLKEFSGYTVETWIAFKSIFNEKTSDSYYTGNVIVQ